MGALTLRAAIRATGVACAALMLAGVGGLLADHGRGGHQPTTASPASGAPSTPGPGPAGASTTTTTAPAASPGSSSGGTDSATLGTDLLVANDLGGYYTALPASSRGHLAASGCLAPLGTPPAGSGRAVQYLRGPFQGQLPDINEQLTAYPTVGQASQAYTSLSHTLTSCTSTIVSLAGGGATGTLAPLTVPALGDEATTMQGPFQLGPLRGMATVAVVRASTTIIVFVYGDRTPPSLAILGSPQSTLRAAVGKASP